MTTTTDLLRRAAELLRKLDHEEIEASDDAASLLALADQMERADPVAWMIRHYSPDCGYFHEYHSLEERGYPPFEVEKYTPLYAHPAPEVTPDDYSESE